MPNSSHKRKLILFGVDQAIPSLIDKFVAEGELPNIKKLIDSGIYTQGLSCPPCDTPTNWTTIATGAPTSIHGATNFYMHLPGESLDKGLEHRSRTQLSKYAGAEYLWESADRQGLKSFVINYPAGWPANLKNGVMSLFSWPIPESKPRTIKSARKLKFSREMGHNDGQFKETSEEINVSTLLPPLQLQFKLTDKEEDILELFIIARDIQQYNTLYIPKNGQQRAQLVKIKQWSDWIERTFNENSENYQCLFRIKLNHVPTDNDDSVKIERSSIYNTKGWATSEEFARKLIKEVHFQDNPEKPAVEYMIEGGVAPFLKYAHEEVHSLAKAIQLAKKTIDWDISVFHIHHLDSVNHKMLAQMLPEFPKYKPKKAQSAESNVRIGYKIVDELLGILMDTVVDENTIILLLADHGAIPAWKNANIPKALADAGLMQYIWNEEKKNYEIDWSQTKVFPYLEPPYIWVNKKGRDPQGIVEPDNFDDVCEDIIRTLMDMRDPENNAQIVRKAARKEDLENYGQNGERIGDIVYFLNPPYQIFDGQLYDLNASIRSKKYMKKGYAYKSRGCYGAHAYYLPSQTFHNYGIAVPIILAGPGVKKGIKIEEKCELTDIAPTLAYLLGIDPPKNSTGIIRKEYLL